MLDYCRKFWYSYLAATAVVIYPGGFFMSKNNVVQNFRARLRRKGYREISLVFIGSIGIDYDADMDSDSTHNFYSLRAFDPLGFAVQAEISDAQMVHWLERDRLSRGGSIFE